ncbi:MFS transporter [Streptomyces sp. NPDC002309]
MSRTAVKAPGDAYADRWKALVFISLAQLMVVLDSTIVNTALPSVQQDLGISDGDRQWVVTAYALSFGALLLFGGRVGDLWGRKRAFVTGLIGFAAASALGGAATTGATMFGARALQGVFGALLAPAALSLLAVLFTDAKERAKAFGIYGAIAGGGSAVGFVLGGALTEYLDWRWTFFVNIPFAIVAAAGACAVVHESEGDRNRSPLDIPGVVLSTLGLASLVQGFTRAESDGWGDGTTVLLFVVAALLLSAFVRTEAKAEAPLLPLRVVTDRNRGGVYLSLGIAVIAMFGSFLFLTYYLQVVKGFSPIESGFSFLPMVAGMMIGSTQVGTRLMTRVAPRYLMGGGFLVAASAMVLLAQLEVDSSYTTTVLPALVLLGLGMGTTFNPAMSLPTQGIEPRDAGVASAMVNASQQVGGAIGTALLNTVAASMTTAYVKDHAADAATRPERQLVQLQGVVHGYANALWVAAGMLVIATLVVLALVDAGRAGSGGVEDEAAVPASEPGRWARRR